MDTSDFSLMPLTATTAGASRAGRVQSDTYQSLINAGWTIQDKDDSLGLEMEDFLQLIVQQFQNQTIDETA